MSTHDVPGANKANNDELSMGCWAEHEDGSMVLVFNTEGGRVIYSMFDTKHTPILEYRGALTEKQFDKTFGDYNKKAKKSDKWTWHDKTDFPWDRVIKAGSLEGPRFASAEDQLSAAAKVAESLSLRAEAVGDKYDHQQEQILSQVGGLMEKIGRALGELRR